MAQSHRGSRAPRRDDHNSSRNAQTVTLSARVSKRSVSPASHASSSSPQNSGIKKRSSIPPRGERVLGVKAGNIPPNHRRQGPRAGLRRLPAQSTETSDLKVRLRAMVKRRHDPETKFFDLTTLAKDPEIENTGMFESKSREAKFFPALMAICETIFPSGFKRKEAVISVSLASNDLPSVAAVTTLAQTFPNIKNLDLSNNKLSDFKALGIESSIYPVLPDRLTTYQNLGVANSGT